MTPPRISVALCTYNGARFLPEQLASIARQTLTPCEVVACDDASSDDSVALLEAFARATHIPVSITRNAVRLGATKNFVQAIGLCGGDLIALADQDDVWLPAKLEHLAATLGQRDAAYAFCDARLIDARAADIGGRTLLGRRFDLRDIEQKFHDDRELDLLLKRDFIYGTTLLFRADLREAVTPIPETWSHDTWIVNVLALLGHRGAPVLEPLVRYRQHSVQTSGGFPSPVPIAYVERVRAYEDLRDRVASRPQASHAKALERLDDKLRFLRALAEMKGANSVQKVAISAREVLSGRWARYSPRTIGR